MAIERTIGLPVEFAGCIGRHDRFAAEDAGNAKGLVGRARRRVVFAQAIAKLRQQGVVSDLREVCNFQLVRQALAAGRARTVRSGGRGGASKFLCMSSLPLDLVLVRHGQSEANVVQKREKEIDAAVANGESGVEPLPEAVEIFARHDSHQRLTGTGRDQAARAGAWLAENALRPGAFTGRFVSPYNRTLETAVLLDPETTWTPDARLVERDWGGKPSLSR